MLQNSKKLPDSDINDKIINEVIHAKEAYGSKGALKTVLTGKRDVGWVELNKENAKKIIKYNIGVIPVRMTSQNTIMSIIYRDHIKAHQLYDIAKQKGGYLTDINPIEARQIGRLLGYSEESIEEYVSNKYGTRVPVLPEKSPDDYNDLFEQNFAEFEKQIEKDEKGHELNKYFLYEEDDFKVYAVNGNAVRSNGFDEWVDGGHHYVDVKETKKEQKYAKFIPEDEVWVDDVFIIKPDDLGAILLHETLERHLMKFYGYVYSNTDKNPGAHEIANMAEVEYRKTSKKGEIDHETSQKTFDEFVKEWGNKNRKKKLNESYQFNKMKDLIRRII